MFSVQILKKKKKTTTCRQVDQLLLNALYLCVHGVSQFIQCPTSSPEFLGQVLDAARPSNVSVKVAQQPANKIFNLVQGAILPHTSLSWPNHHPPPRAIQKFQYYTLKQKVTVFLMRRHFSSNADAHKQSETKPKGFLYSRQSNQDTVLRACSQSQISLAWLTDEETSALEDVITGQSKEQHSHIQW